MSGDSHHGFVNVTRVWRDVELAPYASLIQTAHADLIMVAHLYHRAWSPDGRDPATLSPIAIQKVLRGELGFRGVVITDDLAMGAIRRQFSFGDAVRRSVLAGNDIILMTSGFGDPAPLFEQIADAIRSAVISGRIPRKRIADSYGRIMALKKRLGRLQTIAEQIDQNRKTLSAVP